MDIEVQIIKPIPTEQINEFEDRVIYNCALYTREFTKGANAYPYLTGNLEREEVALPIQKLGNKEYGLGAGVDYAVYVWNKDKVNWTNSATKPKWYATVFENNRETIVNQATNTALKEI